MFKCGTSMCRFHGFHHGESVYIIILHHVFRWTSWLFVVVVVVDLFYFLKFLKEKELHVCDCEATYVAGNMLEVVARQPESR